METFYGLGMIAGPTVGGALYEVCAYNNCIIYIISPYLN